MMDFQMMEFFIFGTRGKHQAEMEKVMTTSVFTFSFDVSNMSLLQANLLSVV